ncbi:MAG: hypothetical protein ABW170_17565 [Candidatus Thiodiazotropha sp. L084R]
MNKKQTATRATKIQKKKQALRKQLWGDIAPETIWNRKLNDGYTTIPRTMPIVFQIMDDLSEKSKPISSTYFSLWCRVFDESFIEIKSPDEMAFESGYSGQRAVSTWKARMKILSNLGFIDAKEGASGQYNYVLLKNPYMVIKEHYKNKKIQEGKFNALFARAQEVGAQDLD